LNPLTPPVSSTGVQRPQAVYNIRMRRQKWRRWTWSRL